jgi:hypothetical protein
MTHNKLHIICYVNMPTRPWFASSAKSHAHAPTSSEQVNYSLPAIRMDVEQKTSQNMQRQATQSLPAMWWLHCLDRGKNHHACLLNRIP